jgi:uncharacterized membrane protein YbhN (UPF0104 family)
MQTSLVKLIALLKKNLHFIGSVLAILAIIFVGFRFKTYWQALDTSRLTPDLILLILALTIIYAFNNIFLAKAWQNILQGLGVKVDEKWAIKTYGISQIAKYIPGNIFHLAGRQALGMGIGISAKNLAQSSAWELGLIAAAGASFAVLLLPTLQLDLILNTNLAINASLSLVLFCLLVATLFFNLHYFFNNYIVKSLSYHYLFLILSASIFTLLVITISQNNPTNLRGNYYIFIQIASAYSIAWLAGLVTPGAPAGIGIREVVLLFFLKNLITESDLLMAILLGRIITVTGDFLFYLKSILNKS